LEHHGLARHTTAAYDSGVFPPCRCSAPYGRDELHHAYGGLHRGAPLLPGTGHTPPPSALQGQVPGHAAGRRPHEHLRLLELPLLPQPRLRLRHPEIA
ncbi:hypothetical protein CFC21_112199, partial [Triticum aestivum]|nr:hypothetical protein [Triticum aestivum]